MALPVNDYIMYNPCGLKTEISTRGVIFSVQNETSRFWTKKMLPRRLRCIRLYPTRVIGCVILPIWWLWLYEYVYVIDISQNTGFESTGRLYISFGHLLLWRHMKCVHDVTSVLYGFTSQCKIEKSFDGQKWGQNLSSGKKKWFPKRKMSYTR